MTILLILLILIPFLGSLVFTFITGGILWEEGLSFGMFSFFLFMGVICIYLGYLLKECVTKKLDALEIPALECDSPKEKRSLASLYVFSVFSGLLLAGLIFLGYEFVRGLLGFFAFFSGGCLCFSAYRAKTAQGSMAKISEVQVDEAMPLRYKFVYFFLTTLLGTVITLSRLYVSSWHLISYWDIAGFLFLLLGTCVWLYYFDRQPNQYVTNCLVSKK